MKASVFEYSDYRIYLRDFYEFQKQKQASYSFRVFARKAKLSSPNYLKLVMDGVRPITKKTLPRFVEGLGLMDGQAEYFKALVSFQEGVEPKEKAYWIEQMVLIRTQSLRKSVEIDHKRSQILRSWRHWAVRELVTLKEFKEEGTWMSSRLKGKVTAQEAIESLNLLLELEFLKRKNGKLVLSDPLISTKDEISSLLLKNLHRQFLSLAEQSLFSDPLSEREFSGLTIALPLSKVSLFKEEIKNFRKNLNKIFTKEDENDEVYQLSIGFFPLTQSVHGGTEK